MHNDKNSIPYNKPNKQAIMKILATFVALLSALAIQAQEVKSEIIEGGGTGEFKSIMVSDASLATHTVFRPQDLSKFGKKNPLPVLVWGNGACANSPHEHINFLNEIASHGFIVVAIGPMPSQGAEFSHDGSESKQLIDAIEWILAQNKNKKSQYYKKIDKKNIAAAGMSCGGLQTLDIAKEPRLKTVMICNSGLFTNEGRSQAVPGMPMPEKSRLKEIHTPIMYMLGGPTDIAYNNGMDDFKRIDHVPAFVCNLNVGHGGTYGRPYGGEFAKVATAWLKWQLKNDDEAGKMFTGNPCGLSQVEGWTTDKKNIP